MAEPPDPGGSPRGDPNPFAALMDLDAVETLDAAATRVPDTAGANTAPPLAPDNKPDRAAHIPKTRDHPKRHVTPQGGPAAGAASGTTSTGQPAAQPVAQPVARPAAKTAVQGRGPSEARPIQAHLHGRAKAPKGAMPKRAPQSAPARSGLLRPASARSGLPRSGLPRPVKQRLDVADGLDCPSAGRYTSISINDKECDRVCEWLRQHLPLESDGRPSRPLFLIRCALRAQYALEDLPQLVQKPRQGQHESLRFMEIPGTPPPAWENQAPDTLFPASVTLTAKEESIKVHLKAKIIELNSCAGMPLVRIGIG